MAKKLLLYFSLATNAFLATWLLLILLQIPRPIPGTAIWIGSKSRIEAVVEKSDKNLLKVAVTPVGVDHVSCIIEVICKSKGNGQKQKLQFSIECYANGTFYGYKELESKDLEVSEINLVNET